jgi:hypothetical protein
MPRSFIISDTLRPGLEGLKEKIDSAVSIAFDAAEPMAAGYARTHAPWRDVTGNARNGLMAKHVGQPLVSHALVVYHTMPYGLFLEVRWSGRYAIIGPTLDHMSGQLRTMLIAAIQRAVS